jgi:transposase InsO family protein
VRGRLQRPGTNLVEARAAVHRSVIPRRERDDGLSPTGAADRCVELARSFVVPRSLGRGATRRTALRIVDQTLAGVEGLFACREGELLRTVSTGQRTVLVHPSQTLLARTRRCQTTGPSMPERGSVAQGDCGRAPGSSGPCPGLIAEKIRVPSRGFERVPCRLVASGTSLVVSCGVSK